MGIFQESPYPQVKIKRSIFRSVLYATRAVMKAAHVPASPTKIGPQVRQARVTAGLTQAELAERAGIADATLSRIERNRLVPSVALAKRIAVALRVPLDELTSPNARPPRTALRPSEARYLAIVRDLDDAVVDDISKGLRLIVAAVKRGSRR